MEKIPSGIYMILNLLNGKRYIGSAVNLEGRRKDHFRGLRNNKGENSHLQSAYSKYGGNAFGWEVLEYVEDLETLIPWENIYLGMYWPTELLYNQCPVARGALGLKWTEEQRRRKSETMLKLWAGENYRQMQHESRMGNQNRKGKLSSDETKRKQHKAMLKRWKDHEYRQNQLNTNPMLQLGYEHTEESKRKSSEAALKSWEDPERRRLQHEALAGKKNPMYGKEHSIETKQKMSKAHTGERNHMHGKRHNAEAKRKMSDARKVWWARRKRAERLLMVAQLAAVLRKRLGRLTAAA